MKSTCKHLLYISVTDIYCVKMSVHAFSGDTYIYPDSPFEYTIYLNPYQPSIMFRNIASSSELLLSAIADGGHLDLQISSGSSAGVIIHGDPDNASAIFSVPDINSTLITTPIGFLVYDVDGNIGSYLSSASDESLLGFGIGGEVVTYSAGSGIIIDNLTKTIPATGVIYAPTFTRVIVSNGTEGTIIDPGDISYTTPDQEFTLGYRTDPLDPSTEQVLITLSNPINMDDSIIQIYNLNFSRVDEAGIVVTDIDGNVGSIPLPANGEILGINALGDLVGYTSTSGIIIDANNEEISLGDIEVSSILVDNMGIPGSTSITDGVISLQDTDDGTAPTQRIILDAVSTSPRIEIFDQDQSMTSHSFMIQTVPDVSNIYLEYSYDGTPLLNIFPTDSVLQIPSLPLSSTLSRRFVTIDDNGNFGSVAIGTNSLVSFDGSTLVPVVGSSGVLIDASSGTISLASVINVDTLNTSIINADSGFFEFISVNNPFVPGFTSISNNTISTQNVNVGSGQFVAMISSGSSPGIFIEDSYGGNQGEWSIVTTDDASHLDLEMRYNNSTVLELHDPVTNTGGVAMTIPSFPMSIISPSLLVGSDINGNIGAVNLGSGLSFSGNTLNVSSSGTDVTFNSVTTNHIRQNAISGPLNVTDTGVPYTQFLLETIIITSAPNNPPYPAGSILFSFTGLPDSSYSIELVSVARSADNRSDAQKKGFHFRQNTLGEYIVDIFSPVGSVAGTLQIDTQVSIPNNIQPVIQFAGSYSGTGPVKWIATVIIIRCTF